MLKFKYICLASVAASSLALNHQGIRIAPLVRIGLQLCYSSLAIMSTLPPQVAAATASSTSINMVAEDGSTDIVIDPDYPGTAVERMTNARNRVKSLTKDQLSGDWDDVRRYILWAGGLKDLPNERPGAGYTGHSFNDFNHCDLTTMLGDVAHNENKGQVEGIQYSNQLGPGIRVASLTELGPGGSWSTCMIGCNKEPPQDVAHLQFKSRIAFKLVWAPPAYTTFVIVDDSGALLNQGTPTGRLPDLSERQQNYQLVKGSKYAVAADGANSS